MTKIACALLLTTLIAVGQAPKEFDVASIRPAADQQQNQAAVGLRLDGSQVHASYMSLKDYLAIAYRLNVNQIVGPDWIASQRFDISAKLPEGAKQSDFTEMLQTLLTDRFRMKVHREMKDFDVYALEVGPTGLKIAETVPASEVMGSAAQPINLGAGGSSAGVSVDYGNGSTFTLGTTTLETKRLTMANFSGLLTRFMDRQVIDMTQLKGGYDLNLTLTPEDRLNMLIRSAVSAGVALPPQALALLNLPMGGSLNDALKKAGLALNARKAPLEVVVVDEAQKTPSEN